MRWSWLIVSLLIGVVCSQNVDPVLRRECNAQITCRDCILANPMCVWCADPNYNATRCYPNGDTQFEQLCSSGMQQNPVGGLGATQIVPLEGFTQVSPARVAVRVRPGMPETFDLSVRPARDFPIDLYLLMDLSFSMRDDLVNLQRLGSDLAASIVDLSNDFSIGFGSFVEKVAGPFTSLDERFQMDPCLNNNNFDCVATYSYRHVISLTNDSGFFTESVLEQKISGNQDLPEGGFDGFLQSLLCTNLIGWRSLSRKLLLYITDAGFHFAGDGKLAGVVLPHPSRCLMPNDQRRNGVDYENSLTYDYPSVGQIAQALREQDIIPIFAAEANVRHFYDALATELGEGAFVGTLEPDSRNVVELVETLYNTISQRVVFDQEPIPGLSVTVTATSCPGGFVEDGICNGLEIERNASFVATVTITECTPALANGEVIVPLRVVGFGTVNIALTALCQCPCEQDVSPSDIICSSRGNLTCGQCLCDSGSFGERCQCDATSSTTNPTVACPTGDNNVQCTGRGSCQCGVCDCNDGFFGAACECDQRDCINQDTGLLCSGRGACGCDGRCTCNVEPVSQVPFNGNLGLCECTPNNLNCRDPSNSTSICNGRGMCGCDGTCECEDPYLGQFCERCSGDPICFTSNCNANRNCANCALDIIEDVVDTTTPQEFFRNELGTNATINEETTTLEFPLLNATCPTCEGGVVIINRALTSSYEISGVPALRCEEIRRGCTYRYFVGVDEVTNNFTEVHVEYIRSCPEQSQGTAPWIIAISIILPLLALGVFLLALLKALLLLWDFVEVKKFENELKNTKYSKNENPLYKSAAKDYQNPLYGQ